MSFSYARYPIVNLHWLFPNFKKHLSFMSDCEEINTTLASLLWTGSSYFTNNNDFCSNETIFVWHNNHLTKWVNNKVDFPWVSVKKWGGKVRYYLVMCLSCGSICCTANVETVVPQTVRLGTCWKRLFNHCLKSKWFSQWLIR